MERCQLPAFCVLFQTCEEIQRASLATKRSAFGDLSTEVADTLQLIGSLEMSEGRAKLAHRTMTKVITGCNTNTTAKVGLGYNLMHFRATGHSRC